jgi:hypothetical protein
MIENIANEKKKEGCCSEMQAMMQSGMCERMKSCCPQAEKMMEMMSKCCMPASKTGSQEQPQ